MTEQSLAAMFKDSAERIKSCRIELGVLSPEVNECCKALDELVEYLENQARVLEENAATLMH